MGKVVVVGSRKPREPGLRWPTPAEAAFLDDPHRRPLFPKPTQRVMRFRSHEAAQADMDARLAQSGLPLQQAEEER